VLIIDSHPITRWGLGRMAAGQPDLDIVGETGTAAEALRLVAGLQPDVVTVGLSLPDRDGLELVRELRDRNDRLGVVVLSSQNEDDVLFRALDTGASAFVAKTASLPEILGAIRHAAVSASSFSAAGLAQAMSRRTEQQARRPLLSPREAEVLGLLQQGKSVPEVAGAMFVSLSTAKTYVSRLYDKLGELPGRSRRGRSVQLRLRLTPFHSRGVPVQFRPGSPTRSRPASWPGPRHPALLPPHGRPIRANRNGAREGSSGMLATPRNGLAGSVRF
jgi:DNA-binding NarL/FixJ family response regulator